jgi:hypothetical protein
MPHYSSYKCSCCGKEFANNSDLVRKKVDFIVLGGGPTVASRTVAWICRAECLPKDPDFQRKAFDAPGMKSPARERVRNAQKAQRDKSAND